MDETLTEIRFISRGLEISKNQPKYSTANQRKRVDAFVK